MLGEGKAGGSSDNHRASLHRLGKCSLPSTLKVTCDMLTSLGTCVLGTRGQHKVSAVKCKIKVGPSSHKSAHSTTASFLSI